MYGTKISVKTPAEFFLAAWKISGAKHCHVYPGPFFKMQMNDKKVNFLTSMLCYVGLRTFISLQKTGKNPRVKSNATFHLMKSSLCPCLLYLDHIFPWVWSCRGNEELVIHKEGTKFFFVSIFCADLPVTTDIWPLAWKITENTTLFLLANFDTSNFYDTGVWTIILVQLQSTHSPFLLMLKYTEYVTT